MQYKAIYRVNDKLLTYWLTSSDKQTVACFDQAQAKQLINLSNVKSQKLIITNKQII